MPSPAPGTGVRFKAVELKTGTRFAVPSEGNSAAIGGERRRDLLSGQAGKRNDLSAGWSRRSCTMGEYPRGCGDEQNRTPASSGNNEALSGESNFTFIRHKRCEQRQLRGVRLSRCNESIPPLRQSLDEARFLSGVSKCLPEPLDRRIQSLVVLDSSRRPHSGLKFFARDEFAWPLQQRCQHHEGLMRQPDFPARSEQLFRAQIRLKAGFARERHPIVQQRGGPDGAHQQTSATRWSVRAHHTPGPTTLTRRTPHVENATRAVRSASCGR